MADNTRINMIVRGASVVTVPIDDTLAIAGQAADAKAVGDALEAKVDAESIMESVQITWNGIQSDNQGVILADADDLPVDGNDSVKDVLDAHGEAIDELGETVENAVLVTEQTLTDAQKAQARANIGAAADGSAVLVTEQTLTAAEQAQVRENIGAISEADVDDVVRHSAQTLTAAQQGQARANIDAKCLVVTGTMTTTGSLTIQNAGITADMVVVDLQTANPGAVAGALSWSTADGSMSLSCSCYAETGVTVYLVHTA